ncbi:hypothetical protein DS909_14430 [Phaeobacter gallaeciensis]|uniref:Uncharacterized protein n=1 Tax=Phaeobacter gallaeciensis TaxID=60890 RepID=A0A366WTY0_9RHOB|nr:hypothetical protein [Phaeobacter gallaeciensis]RBW53324.1 hypothetical protein DS909_14430 [Phaeobacter gallaeciensis]
MDPKAIFLGEQGTSNREHGITFVGDDVFTVKCREMKIQFFTAESSNSEIKQNTFPHVFNVREDSAEQLKL